MLTWRVIHSSACGTLGQAPMLSSESPPCWSCTMKSTLVAQVVIVKNPVKNAEQLCPRPQHATASIRSQPNVMTKTRASVWCTASHP